MMKMYWSWLAWLTQALPGENSRELASLPNPAEKLVHHSEHLLFTNNYLNKETIRMGNYISGNGKIDQKPQ